MTDALRVETFRSGVFVFTAGVDVESLRPLIDRVEDAHRWFTKAPKLPDVFNRLENNVLVSSVHGTNSIEGATFTPEETELILSQTPEESADENKRRVTNIRDAYKKANTIAIDVWIKYSGGKIFKLTEGMVINLHKIITTGLSHPHNKPGQYRDNAKGLATKVGDTEHGGVYTPPKCLKDIESLMCKFVEWINSPEILNLPPLVRAPLAHYYFERIHPFWDGNGRVGRIVEAMILKAAGYKYASLSMSKYYLQHIDEYFTVFNTARKNEEKKVPYPHNDFVKFFLNGMLVCINDNHDYVNTMLSKLLYESALRDKFAKKEINDRQYAIASQLLKNTGATNMEEIRREPWYISLYIKKSHNTASRDIKRLQKLKLVEIDENKNIRPLLP